MPASVVSEIDPGKVQCTATSVNGCAKQTRGAWGPRWPPSVRQIRGPLSLQSSWFSPKATIKNSAHGSTIDCGVCQLGFTSHIDWWPFELSDQPKSTPGSAFGLEESIIRGRATAAKPRAISALPLPVLRLHLGAPSSHPSPCKLSWSSGEKKGMSSFGKRMHHGNATYTVSHY